METFIPAPAIREICEIRGQNNRRFQVEDSRLKDAKALERIAPGRAQHAPGERGVPLESASRAIGLNASGVPHRRDHGLRVPPQHRRRMGDVADRDGFPQGRRGAGKTGRGSRRSRCCKPNLHSFAPSRLRANPLKARECFARSREDAKGWAGWHRPRCPLLGVPSGTASKISKLDPSFSRVLTRSSDELIWPRSSPLPLQNDASSLKRNVPCIRKMP